MQSCSSLAQSRALRTDQESENKKTRLPSNGGHEQWKKIHGIQTRLAELRINLELSWSDDRSSLEIFPAEVV